MRSKEELEMADKERETRGHLAEIVPLLDRIPDSAVAEVCDYVAAALEAAKRGVEDAKNGKKEGGK